MPKIKKVLFWGYLKIADMSETTFPRSPLGGKPTDRYSPRLSKSPYTTGGESPTMRKSPSTKWSERVDGGVTVAVSTPLDAKAEHVHKVTETVEDKTVVKADGHHKGSGGYGMYAIGFIVLFIFIFIIVLAAFFFARPEFVTCQSSDSGSSDDRELDFWKAGIFAFIIAIIFVILVLGIWAACARR
jgi:hypothetical protein